jgi:ABC-2 type transport system permease protein
MRAVLAIAGKDLRVLARDGLALFWAFGFPLLFAVFFGLIGVGVSGAGRVPVAIDDQDGSAASRALVGILAASPSVELVRRSQDEARAAVVAGAFVALVVVPPGFATGGADVQLGVDPAHPGDAGFLQGLLADAAVRARLGNDPEAARTVAALRLPRVVGLEVRPAGARVPRPFEVAFPAGILWGVLGCVTTFAVSMVAERTRGTYQRLRVAPIAHASVLAGKALACALVCLAVIGFLLAVATLALGVRVAGPVQLVLAAASCTACFVGLMMLFAVAGETEAAVAGAAWGAFLPLAMVGGGMIPLVAMPSWLTALSSVSPVKWGILALEGALWRGYGVAQMLLPCAILLAIGALGFVLGTLVLWRRG